MTLETTSGTVQLPVDVQAASRVADEKRRRNAGASARFRQRRKEKEREASTTIGKLEQTVRELSEDMDFYKRERDYLAGVVLQVPGGDRHFPRPPSPRHSRSSSLAGRSGSGSVGYITGHEQGTCSPDDGRNVRRRTSTLSMTQPQQAHHSSAMAAPPSGYHSSYSQHSYGQPLAPQPTPSLHQQGGPFPPPSERGLPQLMQAPPQTGPWNPYADRRPLGGSNQPRDGH